MDGEQNIPTLFSLMLLWLCALLTAGIAWGNRGSARKKVFQWSILAAVFFFMGLDESIQIHERLTEPTRNMLGSSNLFHFAWVLPYMVFVVVFAAIYLRFFLELPRDTRRFVLLAAILYLGGCIGLEIVEGAWIQSHGKDEGYYLLVMIEELLEMSGCLVFIYAFANHIDKYFPDFELRITSS